MLVIDIAISQQTSLSGPLSWVCLMPAPSSAVLRLRCLGPCLSPSTPVVQCAGWVWPIGLVSLCVRHFDTAWHWVHLHFYLLAATLWCVTKPCAWLWVSLIFLRPKHKLVVTLTITLTFTSHFCNGFTVPLLWRTSFQPLNLRHWISGLNSMYPGAGHIFCFPEPGLKFCWPRAGSVILPRTWKIPDIPAVQHI